MLEMTYVEAIRSSTAHAMAQDKSVILIGEGVPDPKAVFGCTKGLAEEFPERVFDMPVSENGMTGVCIGAALNGLKPILVHQRIDFMLYAMDQIVNNAAKWHSMFGGQGGSVPMVMHAIVGRGWGAGNQHSQNLSHLFAMIPGLKVVTPATADDAQELMLWAVQDPNPVVYVSHRWLHNTKGVVPDAGSYAPKIGARVKRVGRNITLLTWSYMVIEAIKAAEYLQEWTGISVEVVDARCLRPFDIESVKASLQKTKRLLVLEEAWKFNSLSSEIITQVIEDKNLHLVDRPERLTLPDFYAASSPHLTRDYYPRTLNIVKKILEIMRVETKISKRMLEHIALHQNQRPHDVPDPSFTGPF